jgi:putative tryptophan/tyrosine transport system substrate-binding protein
MRRREFILALGGAAAWPFVASAQQSKIARIGVLVTANPEPFWTAFRQGLSASGYIEGKNVQFEFRSADAKPDRLRGMADELVRMKVDIIVASLTPAVMAAREATTEIPIVMAFAGDPLATGLIATLARPGGNITGLSGSSPELAEKMLGFIREMVPTTRRVAVLANATDPYNKPYIEHIERGGRSLGIAIQTIRIRGADEFDAAFDAMERERADAVFIQGSLPRKLSIEGALKRRLPLVGMNGFIAREGGLMSYSPNENELYRGAAYYIDRILKGAKPADLPVEQPTKFELIINSKTAKALGLTVPATLLALADEIIE